MEKNPRNYARGIMFGIAFLMVIAVFTMKPPLAGSGISQPQNTSLSSKWNREESQYKIIGVLENKMGGKKLSERAKEKLFSLNEGHTRLIISLCDRIAENEQAAGADIAYFLITALILLS
jgi:hypothetical protein